MSDRSSKESYEAFPETVGASSLLLNSKFERSAHRRSIGDGLPSRLDLEA